MPSPLPPLRISLLTWKPKPTLYTSSLFTLNRHKRQRHQRPFSTTSPTSAAAAAAAPTLPFRPGPSPPRLPKEEQELFETLQRQSTGAFSTPRQRSPPQINQSPDSTPSDLADAKSVISRRTDKLASPNTTHSSTSTPPKDQESNSKRTIPASGSGEELHPNVRRGAAPEFEGDVNPKTGEVGGPKNEPLRWGSVGEWSYNGRTTDF